MSDLKINESAVYVLGHESIQEGMKMAHLIVIFLTSYRIIIDVYIVVYVHSYEGPAMRCTYDYHGIQLQRIGVYNQHAADQLDLSETAVEYLMVRPHCKDG